MRSLSPPYARTTADRLKINLEGEEIEGYALDCEPAAMGNKQGARIRVPLQH